MTKELIATCLTSKESREIDETVNLRFDIYASHL